jgi:hypothetical protein
MEVTKVIVLKTVMILVESRMITNCVTSFMDDPLRSSFFIQANVVSVSNVYIINYIVFLPFLKIQPYLNTSIISFFTYETRNEKNCNFEIFGETPQL